MLSQSGAGFQHHPIREDVTSISPQRRQAGFTGVVKRLAEPGRQPRRVDCDVYLMSAEIEIECEL
jgi:hypothetical protein